MGQLMEVIARYRKRPRAQRVNERYKARRRAPALLKSPKSRMASEISESLLYTGFERLDVSYITADVGCGSLAPF
jgi:hypothetical protein